MRRNLERSRPVSGASSWSVFLVVFTVGTSASATHLDRTPPCEGACIDSEFLERVVGAAEVTVSLSSSEKALPKISLDRWLLKPPEDIDVNAVVPSRCVPDRSSLAARLAKGRSGPYDYPKALEMALASNDYSLVLFLGRARSKRIEARCELELAINWTRLPFFAKRLAWLREQLTGVEHCPASTEKGDAISPADQLRPIVRRHGACAGGLKQGVWVYDLGARMTESGRYEAGRRTGPWVFRNGPTYKETTEYRDGRRHGHYVAFESGREVEEGWFTNGLRSGTWRAWSPAGKLLREEAFRDGSPVALDAGQNAP